MFLEANRSWVFLRPVTKAFSISFRYLFWSWVQISVLPRGKRTESKLGYAGLMWAVKTGVSISATMKRSKSGANPNPSEQSLRINMICSHSSLIYRNCFIELAPAWLYNKVGDPINKDLPVNFHPTKFT